MKYNVCVVTGTRAEYGLLRPVLNKLSCNEKINLNLVVTGTHLSSAFGNTQDEIKNDGFNNFVSISIPTEDDSKEGMAFATGEAVKKFSAYFAKNNIDLLLVLGDRFEIFAASIAAHLMNIPIAHISGGDVTEGAVDDAIRHCITKMSTLHFPGCEQSRLRIIQMGESPDRVYNVGDVGVENCLRVEKLSREELAEQLNFDGILGDYAVVTFHPVTKENDTAITQVRELISAMDEFPDMAFIVTMANADAGGRAINEEWAKACKSRKNWLLVSSLGVKKYLSAVKYCRVVIGNSSSGVIEAPALKVPTINIGDRQKGRMMAKSVICCQPTKNEMVSAVRSAIQPDFYNDFKNFELPFGNGTASQNIIKIIIDYLEKGKLKTQKKFFDINFNL